MSGCIAFGPEGSYLFESSYRRAWKGLPPRLESIFTSEDKLHEVHELAIGPDNSWAVIYTTRKGTFYWSSGVPTSLERWIIPVAGGKISTARNLKSLNIALGPNNAYFAFDNKGAAWGNLPPTFDARINEIRDSRGSFKSGFFPQSVSFGPEGAYVMTCVGGGGYWNLHNQCPDLDKDLHDSKSLKGRCIVLAPSRAGTFVSISSTGNVFGSFPPEASASYYNFKQDWSRSISAMRTRGGSSSSGVASGIKTGLSIANSVLKLANAFNGNGGGGGGGGGGDNTYVSTTTNTMDMSSFWAPINNAANDPIQ